MSDLSEFDLAKKTKPYRQDIFFSLKDMVAVGVREFTGSLGTLIGTPASGKNQITKSLSRRERRLQRLRES